MAKTANKEATEPWVHMGYLKSSLRKFYGRHHDLADRYGILCHKEPRLYSTCRKYFPVISSFMTCSGTAHPSVALEFTPVFLGFVIFSFMCMFCILLFVLLSFFFWSLCCLSFFNLRILINPLVSASANPYWS